MKLVISSITLFRLLVGIAIFYLAIFGWWQMAFCLVILGELSDLVDGPLARKFNVTTQGGKLFDLTADIFFDQLVVLALFVVGKIAWPVWIIMALVIIMLRLQAIFEKRWLWILAVIAVPIHGVGMIWLIVKYYSVNALGIPSTIGLVVLGLLAAIVIVYLKRDRIVNDFRKARQSL
jgi:phosphatidylglycerophosphate synthase